MVSDAACEIASVILLKNLHLLQTKETKHGMCFKKVKTCAYLDNYKESCNNHT